MKEEELENTWCFMVNENEKEVADPWKEEKEKLAKEKEDWQSKLIVDKPFMKVNMVTAKNHNMMKYQNMREGPV